MKEEDKKRIEELIAGIQCPKDFKCINSSLEGFCKVNDF
jgi:hypothetical protein